VQNAAVQIDSTEVHVARLVPSRGDISSGSARPSLLTGRSEPEGDCGPYTSVVWTECTAVMMK
jgi:hypothetical protein